MSLLLNLIRQSRWMLLVALIISIVGGFANAGLVAIINQALGTTPERLPALGWQFLLLAVAVLITRTLSQTAFVKLGQNTKAALRMRTIHSVTDASYQNLDRQGPASALTVLTSDLDTIVVFFLSLPSLAMNGAVVLGCLAYLGYLSWQVLVFAVITVVAGALGFHLANTRAMFHLRTSRDREDDLVKDFRALFDGAKELKLHRRRKNAFVNDSIAANVEAVRVQRTRGYVLYTAAASWGSMILLAFIGCVLFVLTRFHTVDVHVLSGYAVVFLYMIMPIEGLLSSIPSLSSAKVALERIDRVNRDLPKENVEPAESATSFENIALKDVTHSYFREKENEVFTLGPVNLAFRPGELVYLIGGNGSGKTTLAKMIVGLYIPEGGHVELNGRQVNEADRDRYRHHFSVVFNDFFLFDELHGFAIDGLDKQAQELLELLHLEHKVTIRDGKFSTTDLSQGQRKRLALLVAYLEDRPFYVFDEWAADQDPTFKDVFYRRLLPDLKARGKTVLVITHDDRYFALADRYIKLDYGQIVATGDGRELEQHSLNAAA
ncbi:MULTISPECIES: cyclic peptide export ABC transporter [unclassified Caballeronia]|uniref:cyclic peptide export ABC transporter n=1 Tax=unclassified Caballeronia TaxID=2646786 RepID=UPI0028637E5D|nr:MULTISPECIES: cyclic peptide export ABC transporter [unclassified Caballeronia]MDR5776818.1 cyclic peptide export ABC transporter [Caballeronia sp. LZ002]MDR5798677.1 cyclic peptide export ABC transporter [Caballeronia sp. LZ001]MDR5852258.1 cyclic peptide export ABC transporter [Caballeronia sp. LZ003]